MEDNICYECRWWIANPKNDDIGKCIIKCLNTKQDFSCKKFKPNAGEDNP